LNLRGLLLLLVSPSSCLCIIVMMGFDGGAEQASIVKQVSREWAKRRKAKSGPGISFHAGTGWRSWKACVGCKSGCHPVIERQTDCINESNDANRVRMLFSVSLWGITGWDED
jgi:hypothetical protein